MTDETTNETVQEVAAEAEVVEAPANDDATDAPEETTETTVEITDAPEDIEESEAAEKTADDAPVISGGPSSIEELKPGMEINGKVKAVALYGAFIDVGVGKDALLHISQLGQQNVRNVEDVVKPGEQITVYILKVDAKNGRIALSTEKPAEKPLSDLKKDDVVTGKVVRIENFGAFVDIGAERPGMIHVSELSTDYISSPEDVVSVGDEIQVKVLKVNRKRRQIDLSIKALEEQEQREVMASISGEDDEPMPTAMELALRAAMNGDGSGEGGDSANITSDRKSKNSKKRKKALNEALQRTLNQDV
ncbi:MAG: S1 RNA-binding domain-containing protein [Chloroflexota bacterium]